MTKAIISLSGGLDSAVLLAHCLKEKREVECIGFSYGSKHNPYENKAAQAVADYYQVPFRLIDLSKVMEGFKSNLLRGEGEIPEGHYEADNMSLTVVPGRNIIFISILSGLAWSVGASEVWIGVHSGDHLIYSDCRPQFVAHMGQAIYLGTDNIVSLVTPFLNVNKSRILAEGLDMKVPFQLTRTCYSDQKTACGKCGACQERREAFQLNNAIDPISYEYTGPLFKKESK
jgi:7-cyano-7-deazaguanine synthase